MDYWMFSLPAFISSPPRPRSLPGLDLAGLVDSTDRLKLELATETSAGWRKHLAPRVGRTAELFLR